MKIGIDAKFASSHYGGLGAYSIHIIEALARLHRDEIVAFVPSTLGPNLELSRHHQNLSIHSVPSDPSTFKDFYDFRVYWEQEVLPAQLENLPVDVFFSPAFMAPLQWKGAKVVTVHDLLFERSPYFNSERSTTYYRTWARPCAEQADAIITVSRFTANDVHLMFKLKGSNRTR